MAKFLDLVENDEYEGEKYHTFLEVTEETQPALDKLRALFDRADVPEEAIGLWNADPRINDDTIDLLEEYSGNSYASGFAKGKLTAETVEKLSELESIEDAKTLGMELLELFHVRRGIERVP